MTEWRPVEGFPYLVGDDGSIVNANTGKKLRPEKVNGYLRVDLRNNKKRLREFVHRLVLLAFVGPAPNGCQTAHLDGNPYNNNLSNLEWKTNKENIADKYRHGTMPLGEKHWASLLTDAEYASIVSSTQTSTELAKSFNIKRGTIDAIRRRHKLRRPK